MVWWRTGNGVNCTKEGKMVTWHSLKNKNKFVNEENNLYQDLEGSHKATMLQFLHLSQVKNFQPLWFLWFLCPCHKVATNSFLDLFLNDFRYWVDYWCVIVSWWVTVYVSVPSIDFWQHYVNSKKRPFRIFSKCLRVFSLFIVHKCECFMMF